jgi:putative FmdB family regulatory protein
MPIYEFVCDQCSESFDIFATIQQKEDGLHPVCPNCGNETTRQLISTGMFMRRGGMSNFNPPGCGPNSGPGCCG